MIMAIVLGIGVTSEEVNDFVQSIAVIPSNIASITAMIEEPVLVSAKLSSLTMSEVSHLQSEQHLIYSNPKDWEGFSLRR